MTSQQRSFASTGPVPSRTIRPNLTSTSSHWRFLSPLTSRPATQGDTQQNARTFEQPENIPLTKEGLAYFQQYYDNLKKEQESKVDSTSPPSPTPKSTAMLTFHHMIQLQAQHQQMQSEREEAAEHAYRAARALRKKLLAEQEEQSSSSLSIQIPTNHTISPFSTPHAFQPNFIPSVAQPLMDAMPLLPTHDTNTDLHTSRDVFLQVAGHHKDASSGHLPPIVNVENEDGEDDSGSEEHTPKKESGASSRPSSSSRSSTPVILWRQSTRIKEAGNLPVELRSIFMADEGGEGMRASVVQAQQSNSSLAPSLFGSNSSVYELPESMQLIHYNLEPRYQAYRTRFKNKERKLKPV